VVHCMKRRIVEEWKHGWIEKRIEMRWREVVGDWIHATGNGASVTENEIGIGCDACTGEGVMYLCCILEICDVNSVRLIYHALYSLHTYGYSCDICSVR
jgi:hypothetical protein